LGSKRFQRNGKAFLIVIHFSGIGTLKMWNSERGCGFIADDAGGPDIFLQVSALLSGGIYPDNVKNGDRLTFDVESSPQGKTRACNVRRPG
jgi:cold shock protein